MLTYSEVKTFVTTGLTALDYGTTGPVMPTLDPGPPTLAKLQKKTPNALVFLTVGNGVGLAKEGLYDRPFIVVRVIGLQRDYDYAEALMKDLDALLLAVGETQPETMGATRVLYITRNGTPSLIDFDDADRYHWQATYIAEASR